MLLYSVQSHVWVKLRTAVPNSTTWSCVHTAFADLKLKLTLTLALTLSDTGGAVLTLMLGYRSFIHYMATPHGIHYLVNRNLGPPFGVLPMFAFNMNCVKSDMITLCSRSTLQWSSQSSCNVLQALLHFRCLVWITGHVWVWPRQRFFYLLQLLWSFVT